MSGQFSEKFSKTSAFENRFWRHPATNFRAYESILETIR